MKNVSQATQLRQLRADNKLLLERVRLAEMDARTYRARASRAEGEAADWRKRFDLLLSRLAVVQASVGTESASTEPGCNSELLTVCREYDAYMRGHFSEGPDSSALHSSARVIWKHVLAAIEKAERTR